VERSVLYGDTRGRRLRIEAYGAGNGRVEVDDRDCSTIMS